MRATNIRAVRLRLMRERMREGADRGARPSYGYTKRVPDVPPELAPASDRQPIASSPQPITDSPPRNSAQLPKSYRSGRLHWLVTGLVSLAFAGNGIALAGISFALPGIRREWDLSPLELGSVSAGAAAGQMCGSLLVGWLADRLGRRISFAATIALAGAAIGLAGLAPSAAAATLLLFIAGIGLSGVAPVSASLLSEFSPPQIRGQLMAWTQVFWATGWCVMAAAGAALSSSVGWRWIFALGASPILLALVSWRFTPESPRFLLAQGRRSEAEALVQTLEERYGLRPPLPDQQRADRRTNPLQDLRELWSPPFRRRTITLWMTWFVMIATFGGPIVMLPALLAGTSGNDALAARSSLMVALFMPPAGLLAVLLIERAGRRPLLLMALGVSALGTLGLAFAGSELAIILSGGILAGGLLAAWPIILGYTAELYPTRVRATAAGWAGAVTRGGGILAPLLLGGLLSAWGGSLTLALGVFGAMLVFVFILVAVLGEETRGRTLEELSG